MTRGERRYRSDKVARKRWAKWPYAEIPFGRYRKWNMTCDCSMCKCIRYCGIRMQRLKDERRNLLALAVE